jgi:hypothetical protein
VKWRRCAKAIREATFQADQAGGWRWSHEELFGQARAWQLASAARVRLPPTHTDTKGAVGWPDLEAPRRKRDRRLNRGGV